MGRPSGTGIPDDQKKALARVLRAIKDRDFPSVTAMAKAWGMEQSYLNQLCNASAGAGVSTLMHIREKSGLSIDTLLGLDLLAVHLVRDAQIGELVAKQDPVEPQVTSITESFERLPPVRVQEPPKMPKPSSRPRLKPHTP